MGRWVGKRHLLDDLKNFLQVYGRVDALDCGDALAPIALLDTDVHCARIVLLCSILFICVGFKGKRVCARWQSRDDLSRDG